MIKESLIKRKKKVLYLSLKQVTREGTKKNADEEI